MCDPHLAKRTLPDAGHAGPPAIIKTPLAQVLAIEEDAATALGLRRLLRPFGAETTIASSGEQAMKLVRRRRFDLILSNFNLPGINGLVVCRRLKEDAGLKHIPIIFLTGESGPGLVEEAFRVGAVDCLTRPCRREDFLTRVLVHLVQPFTPDETANQPGPTLQIA